MNNLTTKFIVFFSTLCITVGILYSWQTLYKPKIAAIQMDQLPTVSTQFPLVVILMVKNEADFMEKTLMPFIQAGVQGFLILDTGSTDATIANTRKLFSDHNVEHGYIVEQPFIDFSASRNFAMECAEQIFKQADFFFMIDAEWYTQNVPLLLKYCIIYSKEPIDALKILVHYKNKQYYVSRILKAANKIRFASVVHEYAQIKIAVKLPEAIFVSWDDSEKGFEKSKERFKRDIGLLLKQHQQNPTDLRTIYYIGQTYTDLQDYQNAILWYKKRYEITEGWLEERLLSCMNIAKIYDMALNDWPLAQDYYLKAYQLNPLRAEPLVRLAQHYLQAKDYWTCFLFARQAVTIPYPTDAVSVEPSVYFDTRYDILASAAWSVGEYEVGEAALKKALEHNPKDAHLLKNLKAFQDRKKK